MRIGRHALIAMAVALLAACTGGSPIGSTRPAPTATATPAATTIPSVSPTLFPYVGAFTTIAPMTIARNGHTATLLLDGTVLVVGGQGPDGAALASAEIYDPTTKTFRATGSLHHPRTMHTATLLLDGTVLIAGGGKTDPSPAPEAPEIMGLSCCSPVTSLELYHPATGTFSEAGDMLVSRFPGMTATLLADGRVLFVGGHAVLANGDIGDALASAEIYDPATGTSSATGSMADGRYGHSATRLQDGQVLIAGGQVGSSGANSMSAELYDPGTRTFRRTGQMLGYSDAFHTATLLANGRVLIVGWGDNNNVAHPELYESAGSGGEVSGFFVATGTTGARPTSSAALLADGRVLVVGGQRAANLATAVIFDPATGTFIATGSLSTARRDVVTTALADGTVLVIGGTGEDNNPMDSVELFH